MTVQIPALIGKNKQEYLSLDRRKLAALDGSPLADVTVTPPLLVNAFARKQRGALQAIPVASILQIFSRAADIFETGRPEGLGPDDFIRNVALGSGLPIAVSRRRTVGLFPQLLRSMRRFLEVQSPGELRLYDTNVTEIDGICLRVVPRGPNAGFVMPGNHPAPHFIWLGALAMKVPVIVRPSADDPFTPYRLARALIEAGLPEDAIGFVPGGHELVETIINSCGNSILFGGAQLTQCYSGNPRVQIHGPGRSKIVVLPGADFDRTVDLIARLVLDDGGRGCVNASAVIVDGNADLLAHAVAAKLEQAPTVSLLCDDAVLGATPPAHATAFAALIERALENGARLHGSLQIDRQVTIDGMTILRPVVLGMSHKHPVFGTELPFPFITFASILREGIVEAARNSLTVTVVGTDSAITDALLLEPSIEKLVLGYHAGIDFDPLEPQQGYLFDFLFQKKAASLNILKKGAGNPELSPAPAH